jgi:hypothetical protein
VVIPSRPKPCDSVLQERDGVTDTGKGHQHTGSSFGKRRDVQVRKSGERRQIFEEHQWCKQLKITIEYARVEGESFKAIYDTFQINYKTLKGPKEGNDKCLRNKNSS